MYLHTYLTYFTHRWECNNQSEETLIKVYKTKFLVLWMQAAVHSSVKFNKSVLLKKQFTDRNVHISVEVKDFL